MPYTWASFSPQTTEWFKVCVSCTLHNVTMVIFQCCFSISDFRPIWWWSEKISVFYVFSNERTFHLSLLKTWMLANVCRGAKFVNSVFWYCWCSTKLFAWTCFAFLEECLYRFFFKALLGFVRTYSLCLAVRY